MVSSRHLLRVLATCTLLLSSHTKAIYSSVPPPNDPWHRCWLPNLRPNCRWWIKGNKRPIMDKERQRAPPTNCMQFAARRVVLCFWPLFAFKVVKCFAVLWNVSVLTLDLSRGVQWSVRRLTSQFKFTSYAMIMLTFSKRLLVFGQGRGRCNCHLQGMQNWKWKRCKLRGSQNTVLISLKF